MRGPLQDMLATRGLRLDEWKHLRSHHRPGGAVSALYRVSCRPRTGAAGGPLTLHVGVTTADAASAASAAAVSTARMAGLPLQLWLHPHDPVLVSLPWALDAGAVSRDVFGTGTPAQLSLAAYRPLRRAVVRAALPDRTAYLKLLPPALLPGLRRRHELLAASDVPAPVLLPTAAAAARDAVVLSALPGVPLFRLLAEDGTAAVPAETLLQLLDALPREAMDLPRRPAWAERAGIYARAAAAALPSETHSIRELAAGIGEVLAAAPAGPLVPVHGDFHEGNLLVTGTRITGLLDVDGLGPGRRVDDLACLLGHLSVLAAAHPERFGPAFGTYCLAFEETADPAALYARTAGVVLTLVAGARAGQGASRTRQARLRLATAQQLLRRARG